MHMAYISILTNLILTRYFDHSRCVLTLTDEILHLERLETITFVHLLIANNSIPADHFFRRHGCQGFVIQSKHALEIFENLEYEIRRNSEMFNSRRYLFLPSSYGGNSEIEVFRSKALYFVADVVVVSYRKKSSEVVYQFLTHKYVGKENNSEIIVLDKWFSKNESFLNGRNLYPDKINNLQGRPIRLATFTYLPYTYVGTVFYIAYICFLKKDTDIVVNFIRRICG